MCYIPSKKGVVRPPRTTTSAVKQQHPATAMLDANQANMMMDVLPPMEYAPSMDYLRGKGDEGLLLALLHEQQQQQLGLAASPLASTLDSAAVSGYPALSVDQLYSLAAANSPQSFAPIDEQGMLDVDYSLLNMLGMNGLLPEQMGLSVPVQIPPNPISSEIQSLNAIVNLPRISSPPSTASSPNTISVPSAPSSSTMSVQRSFERADSGFESNASQSPDMRTKSNESMPSSASSAKARASKRVLPSKPEATGTRSRTSTSSSTGSHDSAISPSTASESLNSNPKKRRRTGAEETKVKTEDQQPLDPVALKRMRNTEAARRSRMRKVVKMETLEHEVKNLETSNEQLRIRLAVMENEKITWMTKEQEYHDRIQKLEEQVRECHSLLAMGYNGVPTTSTSGPVSTQALAFTQHPRPNQYDNSESSTNCRPNMGVGSVEMTVC